MERMLVVVFDSEQKAFEGTSALRQLEVDGNVSIYAGGVVVKHANGTISVSSSTATFGQIVTLSQIPTNAGVAGYGGVAGIFFAANIYGVIGNSYSIALVNPGAANVPLSVAVVGTEVIVTLATNGASVITSTYAQVAAAINANAAASALIIATSASATVAVALAQQPLSGGAASVPVLVQGTLLGVKLWKDC